MGWFGKETLKLTGGEQESIVILEESFVGDTIEIGSMEAPITLKKWYQYAHSHPKCSKCHKEMGLWEVSVNVCNYYSMKKKGRMSYKCWACASEEM